MGIKTDIFTTEMVQAFYARITENDVYFFGSDYNASNISLNSNFTNKDVLEKTIFGLRIEEEDVAYMVKNNLWAPNIVYDIYDDISVLTTSNYYVIVSPESEDGDYHAFKCIFNNNGSPSTSRPQYSENILESGGYSNVADGYIWKYMFTVTDAQAKKFKTNTFFPIIEDPLVANAAIDGLDTILVENFQTNFGYKRVIGTANTQPEGTSNRVYLTVAEGYHFDETAGTYEAEVIYFTRADEEEEIIGKTFVIKTSGKSEGRYYVEFENYTGYTIQVNDNFEILPRIIITGDGTGAEGITVFDPTNTRINSVKLISKGSGYTSATATVVRPKTVNLATDGVEATLRPIIAPLGGHGSNVVKELRSDAVCISGTITSFSTEIPDSGTYSKIALVYEPIFVDREANSAPITAPDSFVNMVRLTSDASEQATVGEAVSQTNGAHGIVHSIVGDYIYVINFTGNNSAKFDENLTLGIGTFSINITEVVYPSYLERTGEVLYITDFQPVTRSETKEELIKILVDF